MIPNTDIKIFAKTFEDEAAQQVATLASQPAFYGAKIRIMPDGHAGSGCVVGFTADLGDRVIPNVVGVDISCGMLLTEIKAPVIDFGKLDGVIHDFVPSGRNAHPSPVRSFDWSGLVCAKRIRNAEGWVDRSLGTLGGGNHFIEVDESRDGRHFLIIHSGSRNLGLQIAKIYQAEAVEDCDFADRARAEIEVVIARDKALGQQKLISEHIAAVKKKYEGRTTLPKELCYVIGQHHEDYLHDAAIAGEWAHLNRATMTDIIFSHMGWERGDQFECLHNYIGDDGIIRKGAISAREGERVIIPLNMHDGVILGRGKGNDDWNCSAPHGAGRRMSRTEARKSLSMDDFRAEMKGIYTTSVVPETIDEAPQAYKDSSEILDILPQTVDIEEIIKPVYNFKAKD